MPVLMKNPSVPPDNSKSCIRFLQKQQDTVFTGRKKRPLTKPQATKPIQMHKHFVENPEKFLPERIAFFDGVCYDNYKL